jgi:hypothetical protein
MLSVLATTTPAKKRKKVPKPHDDPKIEYSKFVALPPEENVPEPATIDDIAMDAEEVEPELEEVDEWQATMQAAEDEMESEVASRTDDLEFDDEPYEKSDDDEPFFPEVVLRRAPKQPAVVTYEGRPLDFDDEYVP